MGAITEEIRIRLDAGENPLRLKLVLVALQDNVRAAAGYNGPDVWDIGRLHQVSLNAEVEDRPTPLQQLRDAEEAAALIEIRMAEPPLTTHTSETVLAFARTGRTWPLGEIAESRELHVRLLEYRQNLAERTRFNAATREVVDVDESRTPEAQEIMIA